MKDEHKALKELQSDTSIVILPADKGRSTVILNREDYLEKCMDHINNGPYQLLKKDPTTKIKTKTLKQLKVLKDNKFIDNKLYYYLKPANSPRVFPTGRDKGESPLPTSQKSAYYLPPRKTPPSKLTPHQIFIPYQKSIPLSPTKEQS